MILIADSGSSKTDWRLIKNDGEIEQYRGIGFNPSYQTSQEMAELIQEAFLLGIANDVTEVFYYGAGCSTDLLKDQVRIVLQSFFTSANVNVDHDMMAAARATFGNQAGIACILGTGSNSCDYDGYNIVNSMPSPGYIFGDEGGGAYVGKRFLQDFIQGELPDSINKLVSEELKLDYEDIIAKTYKMPFPNRYMASFCKFISSHKNDPYCYMLYYDSFQDFFNKHIKKYANYKEKQVNFVGSIAFFNSDILRSAAADAGIQVNLILESPIAGLSLYHRENHEYNRK
ncbi:N-acetylglucosamine kinase [Belliella sp. R4-6]|uniref:N-acetylglucosamine kinase n=1 Tax=Belliella alkalica TaxID=1730871 RepID=A0ABS9VA69_9BACT|nr:N-acetylglucosamine kinase [Belliella alkalica]MCH7413332.1 N-acetylglucosamine kinase [Belliella alkalica]